MLPSDGQHYNSVLAEIIVSNRVGLVHIGLVGDLLSVGARFSMLTISGVRISNDRWIEIAEEAADLEDAYKLAWRMVVSETRTENKEKAPYGIDSDSACGR